MSGLSLAGRYFESVGRLTFQRAVPELYLRLAFGRPAKTMILTP
ncbi:hypothetical protein HMP0721_1927 [Pseudoramibacter alactolyticus ATCC 23263]|uniref:Uncharacterized protein n=1 Tax=Pseudoramibacter alactolyticus ATCC 23263 TaxID=887929 RepID=E6MIU2_9FIRM|nr:hypothetical protein HMP0721_1927 [Pseudoramibacter alactolyticus ATCC 23263]